MNKTVKIRIVLFWFLFFTALSIGFSKIWKSNSSNAYEKESIYENVEYYQEKEPVSSNYLYILRAEDDLVYIFYANSDLLYDRTSILVDELPRKLRNEIEEGKPIKNQEELYDFLENFSS